MKTSKHSIRSTFHSLITASLMASLPVLAGAALAQTGDGSNAPGELAGLPSPPTLSFGGDMIWPVESLSAFIALRDAISLANFQLLDESDFSHARLVFERMGGLNPADQFAYFGDEVQLSGGRVFVANFLTQGGQDGVDIGAYQLQPGRLQVEFTSAATADAVDKVIRSLRYRNNESSAESGASTASVSLELRLENVARPDENAELEIHYVRLHLSQSAVANSAPRFQYIAPAGVYHSATNIAALTPAPEDGVKILSSSPADHQALHEDGSVNRNLGDQLQAFGLSEGNGIQSAVGLSNGGAIAASRYAREFDEDWGWISQPLLFKYLPDGSIDAGWRVTKFHNGSSGIQLIGGKIATDSLGRTLVLGGPWNKPPYIAGLMRFDAQGKRDATFRGGYIDLNNLAGSGMTNPNQVLPMDDGTLILGETSSGLLLVKLDNAGQLDTRFNQTGYFALSNWKGAAVGLQGEQIVLAKSTLNLITGHKIELMRLQEDGSIDSNFHPEIAIASNLGDAVNVHQLRLLASGKLLVLAEVGAEGASEVAIMRLHADGSLDQSFAEAGHLRYAPLALQNNIPTQVTELADERLLIVANNRALFRLTEDGAIDPAFQPQRKVISVTGSDALLQYVPGSAPVQLMAQLQLLDPELAAAGNYAGLSITLSAPLFSTLDVSGRLSIVANQLLLAGEAIASVSREGGNKLKVVFNANATQAAVDETVQAFTFANTSINAQGKYAVSWLIEDGSGGKLNFSSAINVKKTSFYLQLSAAPLYLTQRQSFSHKLSANYLGDGSKLVFSAENLPQWMQLNAQTGELSGTPSASAVGRYDQIVVSVSDGINRAIDTFAVEVAANNSAPQIAGEPRTLALVNQPYHYQPLASDSNGDALSFSVQNLPAWAVFDELTGAIAGVPQLLDVGTFSGIVITARDAQSETAMSAFDITVRASNAAPQISGRPTIAVPIGQRYVFAPQAVDGDGDTLRYSAHNLPQWADLDEQTGVISGTPGASDVGSYVNVELRVSDGLVETALPAFNLYVVAQVITPEDFHVAGGQAGERLGTSLALGAIDPDAMPALLVGAAYRTAIVNGKKQLQAGAVDLIGSQSQRRDMVAGYKRQRLGAAVAVVGDYNDDGVNDLVVGKPGVGKFGAISLYSGRDGRLIREIWQPSQLPAVEGVALKGRVGEVLAVADVDADGVEDLIIGMPSSTSYTPAKLVKAGAVVVFDGLSNRVKYSLRGDQAGAEFGAAIAASSQQLLVASPLFDVFADKKFADAGRVQRFAANSHTAVSEIFGTEKRQYVGDAVADFGVDITGDGKQDWLVSQFDGQRQVQLQLYSGESVVPFTEWPLNTAIKRQQLSLAAGADLDGDGIADVAIAMPFTKQQSLGSSKVLKQAGDVRVLSGADFLPQ